jgi:hypothetical protein
MFSLFVALGVLVDKSAAVCEHFRLAYRSEDNAPASYVEAALAPAALAASGENGFDVIVIDGRPHCSARAPSEVT